MPAVAAWAAWATGAVGVAASEGPSAVASAGESSFSADCRAAEAARDGAGLATDWAGLPRRKLRVVADESGRGGSEEREARAPVEGLEESLESLESLESRESLESSEFLELLWPFRSLVSLFRRGFLSRFDRLGIRAASRADEG